MKFLIFVFLLLISSRCANSDIFNFSEEDNDVEKLDNNQIKETPNIIQNLKESELKHFSSAKFKILNITNGKVFDIMLNKNKKVSFKNFIITMKSCYMENGVYTNNFRSFVEITNNTNNKTFKGWVFSEYKMVEHGKLGKYLFFLDRCENIILKDGANE